MALALFCIAGVCVGLTFDLFALLCVSALAVPAAAVVSLGAGMGQALVMAGGAMLCLQIGFGFGLAALRFSVPLKAYRAFLLPRRRKL
jgi:hypothetical protein